MNLSLRVGLSVLGLMMPAVVCAAPPNVTGISALQEGTGIRVSWAQVAGADISAYRIYYSHTSILGNNGLYDDFETVDGTVNTYLLQNIPAFDELFFSVLAVDANGKESPYFLEEARITLQQGTSQASSMQTQGFQLLSAQAISATGVTLTFSHQVSIPQEQSLHAIIVQTASGTRLDVRRLIVDGSTITLHTQVQERGTVYRVTVGPVVVGRGDQGQTLMLAADQMPVLFSGHPTGTQPATPPVQQPQTPTQMPDVSQLRLRAQPDGPRSFRVEATWQAPALNPSAGTPTHIVGYSIAQTMNGGQQYGPAHMVGSGVTVVRVGAVPAGNFGVLVKVVYPGNVLSGGQAQMINLASVATNDDQANVIQQPQDTPTATNLPDSGPALWLMTVGISGVLSALHMYRRKARMQPARQRV